MINRQRLIKEFLHLVEIDSPSKCETAIAKYLKEKLRSLGCDVFEDDCGSKMGGSAGNIIGRKIGKSEQKNTIFFSAHMDTIESNFGMKPCIKEDIIYSDGTHILGGDDKGGIAAILEMLQVLQENNINHRPLEIVFTISEETGLDGAKNLDMGLITSEYGYVLDVGGDIGTIVNKAAGRNRIEAVICGQAAHAGFEPEKGINAIQIAGKALAQMELGRIDDETTANIGRIEGGKVTNIIPDMVHLIGEARSCDKEKLCAQTNHMTHIIEKTSQENGAWCKVNIKNLYLPFAIEPHEAVILDAVESAHSIHINPILATSGGGSDANIFNQYNIPTANLSMGMEKAHTNEEYIKIGDLVKITQLLVAIAQG